MVREGRCVLGAILLLEWSESFVERGEGRAPSPISNWFIENGFDRRNRSQDPRYYCYVGRNNSNVDLVVILILRKGRRRRASGIHCELS